MTGRTPTRTGILDWIPPGKPAHLKKNEITIAKLLKEAGYDTGHFGKWHLNGYFNSKKHPQPNDHGFNYWYSTHNNASPTHRNPNNFVRNGKRLGALKGFSCGLVADEMIDWMKNKRDKSKPFFSFVCFNEPHEPVDSPKDLVKLYPDAKKKGEALYYANVSNMDRAVGKIIAAIKKQDLKDNTVVIFTSDNGPETLNRYRSAWRSHGTVGPLRGMKLHIYDGGIRVPGIIYWPGKTKPGQVCDEPVSAVDFLPTLCEAAGIEAPKDRALDGSSFLAIFEGKKIKRKEPLFWHYYRALSKPKVAVRDGDWKLVAHLRMKKMGKIKSQWEKAKYQEITTFELYNIKKDIAEKNDLAAKEPERVKKLEIHLRKKFKAIIQEAFPE